jgi:hypothetical protein
VEEIDVEMIDSQPLEAGAGCRVQSLATEGASSGFALDEISGRSGRSRIASPMAVSLAVS